MKRHGNFPLDSGGYRAFINLGKMDAQRTKRLSDRYLYRKRNYGMI